jgi:hypothetical protein
MKAKTEEEVENISALRRSREGASSRRRHQQPPGGGRENEAAPNRANRRPRQSAGPKYAGWGLGGGGAVAAIRRDEVLGGLRDAALGRVAALAARLLDAPLASVTLREQDGTWLGAAYGLDGLTEFASGSDWCSLLTWPDEVLVVSDALADPAVASTTCGPAPEPRPMSTASRESSARSPCRARTRGRTNAPGWSPRPAAASCSRRRPAGSGRHPTGAGERRPRRASAARSGPRRSSARRKRRRAHGGTPVPGTAPPACAPAPAGTPARRRPRTGHRGASRASSTGRSGNPPAGPSRDPPRPRHRART